MTLLKVAILICKYCIVIWKLKSLKFAMYSKKFWRFHDFFPIKVRFSSFCQEKVLKNRQIFGGSGSSGPVSMKSRGLWLCWRWPVWFVNTYCLFIWKIKSKRSNYFVLGKSHSVQICSSKVSTLESGIDVGGAINVAPGIGKKSIDAWINVPPPPNFEVKIR